MTVKAWVGLHGGGKTYAMTEALLFAKCRGARVFTNYGFHNQDGAVVTADDVMEKCAEQAEAEVRWPTVIALDEAPMLFDCRDARSFPTAMRILLTQCRKLHLDLFYTAQDFEDCDVKLRRQTHSVVKCTGWLRKVYAIDDMTGERLRRPRWFRRVEFSGPSFGRPKADSVAREWKRFDPDVAEAFDSEQLIGNLGLILREEWTRCKARTTTVTFSGDEDATA